MTKSKTTSEQYSFTGSRTFYLGYIEALKGGVIGQVQGTRDAFSALLFAAAILPGKLSLDTCRATGKTPLMGCWEMLLEMRTGVAVLSGGGGLLPRC